MPPEDWSETRVAALVRSSDLLNGEMRSACYTMISHSLACPFIHVNVKDTFSRHSTGATLKGERYTPPAILFYFHWCL